MKAILFCVLFFSMATTSAAQVDHTGNYGFKTKPAFDKDSKIKPGKEDEGKTGDLTLLKIDADRYKFWLSVSRGWPSYNLGEINGIMIIKDGKASFSVMQEYAETLCKINFIFGTNYVEVEQLSTDSDCGFGHAVYADGKYLKRNATRLTGKGLEKIYSTYSRYRIQPAKAYLYEDGKGAVIKKQYFVRGDTVVAVAETPRFIYTEFISASGKFIYGWLKKSELNPIP